MNEMLEKLGQNAKDAESVLRNLSTNDKNKTLEAVAKALVAHTDEILKPMPWMWKTAKRIRCRKD